MRRAEVLYLTVAAVALDLVNRRVIHTAVILNPKPNLMIRSKLAMAILSIAASCALLFVLFQSHSHTGFAPDSIEEAPSSSDVSNVYTNNRFGYTVIIPDGYRLAKEIMSATNNSEATNTDYFVVVTNLSVARESLVAAEIQRLDTQQRLVSAQAVMSGDDFIITPTSESLGLDFAKRLSASPVPGTNIPTVQNIESDTLRNGEAIARYSLANLNDPQMRLDTVFIPYSSSPQRPDAAPLMGFLVQSPEDSNFSESAFVRFYKSFTLSH
jgi:hypothetical protein